MSLVFNWKHVNRNGYIPFDQKDAINNTMLLSGNGQLYIPNGIIVGAINNVWRDTSTTDAKMFAITDNIINFTSGTTFTFPKTDITQKGRQHVIINGTNANITISPTNTTETLIRTFTPGSRMRATSNGVKWMTGL